MKPVTMLAAFAAVLIGVTAVMHLESTSQIPIISFHSIGPNSSALTVGDVEKLLANHYEDVRQVKQIPPAVKQSFTSVTGLPFDMNNPGNPMSTDYIIPGVPTRQLVFADVSDNSAIIVYKQGGYATRTGVVVLSSTGNGSYWWAYFPASPPKDTPSLEKLLQESKFQIQNRSK